MIDDLGSESRFEDAYHTYSILAYVNNDRMRYGLPIFPYGITIMMQIDIESTTEVY